MSLKELQIRDEYRSDGQRPARQGHRDRLIQDFYIPCLEQARTYDRAVSFFSSSSMAAVAQGLTAFVRSQGRMWLVTSPKLSNDDVKARYAEVGLKSLQEQWSGKTAIQIQDNIQKMIT